MKQSKPLIVGLTGTIGSGKSTCSDILRVKFNLPIIDADRLAYQVTEKGSDGLLKIAEEFGSNFILPDGEYNRKLMSETVFTNPEALNKLNQLIHPFIKVEKIKQLSNLKNEDIIIYDCPLLFESGEDQTVDKIVVITSDEEIRKNRIKDRSQLTEQEIEDRINSQDSDESKINKADYIIYNNGSLDQLENNLKNIINDLKNP